MPLTHKQEHFAQLVASGLTQSDAYKQAYDVSPDTLPGTVVQDASHLAAHPNVSPRIQELRQAALAKMTSAQAWNLDRMVSEAETNLDLSRTHKQLGSANGALEIIGRATGILSDKQQGSPPVQVNAVFMGTLDMATLRQLVALRDELLGLQRGIPPAGEAIVDAGSDEKGADATGADEPLPSPDDDKS